MAFIDRLKQLAAKIEATPGTAETLAAADATMLISEVSYSPDIKMFERDILSSSLSQFSRLPGQKAGAISAKTEIKGGGAAGTAPALGVFLQAAGFLETVNAAVDVTYTPVSSAFKNLTVGEFADDTAGTGLRHLIAGALTRSFRITGNIGEPLMAEMEFFGKYEDTIDSAPLAPTLEVLVPPLILGATFTIQGFAAKIASISIDVGPTIALRSDIGDAVGYTSAILVKRKSTMTIDPEQTLVSSHDWMGIFKAGTEGALNLIVGSTVGNIITITAPKVQYIGVSEGSRDGVGTFQLECQLSRNADAGDDELSIKFT